jgi:hypothetical protein
MAWFWRWFDRAARMDFAGTLLSYFFDWKAWLWALVPGGGVATVFWSAIVGLSALETWVYGLLVIAALAAIIHLGLLVVGQIKGQHSRIIQQDSPTTGTVAFRVSGKNNTFDDVTSEGFATAFDLTERAAGNALRNIRVQANQVLPDAGAVSLAGTVRAVLERAMSYGFKLPLPADDIFLKWYEELKNSTHPIWIDDKTNQLRRDFLQYCAIVAQERDSVPDWQSDRKRLQDFGSRLISTLSGEPDFAIRHPALKGQITFNYSLNGGVITIGPMGKNFRLRFSKASNTAIHIYRDNFSYLARVRGKTTGDNLNLAEYQSVDSIAIQVGEHFLAMNNFGQMVQGRILIIKDDMRNDDSDEVCFDYEIAPVRGGAFLAL